MSPVLINTFSWLGKNNYIRHLLFGSIFPIILLIMIVQFKLYELSSWFLLGAILLSAVLTFLYPFSRFGYESAVGYIMGNNVFYLNALVMIFAKLFTMYLCWVFSPLIAPIVLICLYLHQRKINNQMHL